MSLASHYRMEPPFMLAGLSNDPKLFKSFKKKRPDIKPWPTRSRLSAAAIRGN